MQGTTLEWLTMLGEWAIVGAILYEGHIALREYRSARLFDAIKYVEDEETRRARRVIYDKLQRTTPPESWWNGDDKELAEAASTVCARYNLLAAVTKEDRQLREFVVSEWANNICSTYETLRDYMAYREASFTGRRGMFRRYAELYDEARKLSNPPGK